jgi:hypothetical protein
MAIESTAAAAAAIVAVNSSDILWVSRFYHIEVLWPH